MKKIKVLILCWLQIYLVVGQNIVSDSLWTAFHIEMLTPGFWIQKNSEPDHIFLEKEKIITQYKISILENFLTERSMLKKDLILQIDTINAYSRKYPIYDSARQVIKAKEIRSWQDLLNKEKIQDTIFPLYGLITERTLARNFPFYKTILKKDLNPELDRTIESALYLGEWVKIWHQSEDENWFFVESPQIFAWVEKENIALTDYEQWKNYNQETDPFILIRSLGVTTHYHPKTASFNKDLEIGSRFPIWKTLEDFEPGTLEKYHVISIPLRDSLGTAYFRPHLVDKDAKILEGYLDFTSRNFLEVAFEFLGERYGWGGMHQTRDCSSLIGDIYKVFGFILPRNSQQIWQDQRFQKALSSEFSDKTDFFKTLALGGILYFPGHIMLYLGEHEGLHFVMHDILETRIQKNKKLIKTPLMRVVVNPLEVFFSEDGQNFADKILGGLQLKNE